MSDFERWMREQYEPDQLREIAQYGCQQGVPGMIYYSEINEVYDKFRRDLWNIFIEYCEDLGSSPLNRVQSHESLTTMLVWTAAEIVAQRLGDSEVN